MAHQFDHQPLTDLLRMPLVQHKVSKIDPNSNKVEISLKCHAPVMIHHPRYDDALRRLGLYHVINMGQAALKDKALVQALIERWRPETHTFHMPVGEMTITLQDVGCLLGLPVSGRPVTGVAYRDWRGTLQNCLGLPIPDDAWRTKVGNRGFGWSLRLTWLRDNFYQLPANHTDAEVAYHTRAFILEFFGTVLFPTSNGDDVPAMYIQFLQNLDNPPIYNWGGAVLAYLYKALSTSARAQRKTFAACVDLLQLWSWTRFASSRPKQSRNGIEFSDWGVPNIYECHPYGRRWTGRRLWENVHNAGIGPPRDMLDKLEEGRGVYWNPYDEVFDRLPRITQHGLPFWLGRVPLIHFWIVQFYYPDRVMRQFGYRQSVPVPPPVPWEQELNFERVENTDHMTIDFNWSAHFVHMVEWASQPQQHIVQPAGPHDDRWYQNEYMQWYLTHGMPTVFIARYHGSDVRQPRPLPPAPPSSQTYLSQSDVFTRIGMRAFRDAALATKQVITRGWKKIGKRMLLSCRGNLEDVGQSHRFTKLMRDAGLPEAVEDIPVDDDDTSPDFPIVFDDTEEKWRAAYDGALSYDDLWRPPQTYHPPPPFGSQFYTDQTSSQAYPPPPPFGQAYPPPRPFGSQFFTGEGLSQAYEAGESDWVDNLYEGSQLDPPPYPTQEQEQTGGGGGGGDDVDDDSGQDDTDSDEDNGGGHDSGDDGGDGDGAGGGDDGGDGDGAGGGDDGVRRSTRDRTRRWSVFTPAKYQN